MEALSYSTVGVVWNEGVYKIGSARIDPFQVRALFPLAKTLGQAKWKEVRSKSQMCSVHAHALVRRAQGENTTAGFRSRESGAELLSMSCPRTLLSSIFTHKENAPPFQSQNASGSKMAAKLPEAGLFIYGFFPVHFLLLGGGQESAVWRGWRSTESPHVFLAAPPLSNLLFTQMPQLNSVCN